MAVREVRASGLASLALATELLQRARLTDPEAGLWEAADLQWWWRTPRRSDAIDQVFWVDAEGPVASVVLTDWGRAWGCDPIVVPRAAVPVEPMRVEDAYQRRGLARAMLTAGLDRLAKRGARRLKVGYATGVARGLYVGAGFRVSSTSRSWRRRVPRD
jgi:GNAT superfamily N-acetyltransferase